MAETSGPFDGTDLTEADWELMLQHLVDGVPGAPGSSTLSATASGSTARGVDISTGSALVRGHWYTSDALATLTSAANASGAARIDRAVLRLNRITNTVVLALLAGTAGSGPPALTDNATTTERPLWRWTVTPGATTVAALTDERQWLPSLVRPSTSANRPLTPLTGEITYETDTGRYMGWSGVAWKTLGTDDSGEVAVTLGAKWRTAGSNTVRSVGSVVDIDLNLAFGEALNEVLDQGRIDDLHVVTVPSAFRPTRYKFFLVSTGGSGETARLQVQPDGKVTMFQASDDLNYGQTLRATLTYLK